MEGTPVQEIAAIEVDICTRDIVDIFHAYSVTEEADTFAREHIHGLNKIWFGNNTFPSEYSLLTTFKIWNACKANKTLYANGASKEAKALDLNVKEFSLLPWIERKDRLSHKSAIACKNFATPILGRFCSPLAHSSFISAVTSKNALITAAKHQHGYHCALYDVLELYFEWLWS